MALFAICNAQKKQKNQNRMRTPDAQKLAQSFRLRRWKTIGLASCGILE
jgi:hypothetical protein